MTGGCFIALFYPHDMVASRLVPNVRGGGCQSCRMCSSRGGSLRRVFEETRNCRSCCTYYPIYHNHNHVIYIHIYIWCDVIYIYKIEVCRFANVFQTLFAQARSPNPWGAPLPTDALDFALPRPGVGGQSNRNGEKVVTETCNLGISWIQTLHIHMLTIYIYIHHIIYIYHMHAYTIQRRLHTSWFFGDQSFEADSVPGLAVRASHRYIWQDVFVYTLVIEQFAVDNFRFICRSFTVFYLFKLVMFIANCQITSV